MIFCGVIDTGVVTYDSDAQTFFDACTTAGASVTGSYLNYYNNVVVQLKAAGVWSNLDALFIRATGNEVWAKISVKNPTIQSTLNNSYSGRFTTDAGYNGSPSDSFAILTGYNPSTFGGVFTQNSATVGAFFLIDNDAAGPAHDISGFASGFGSENAFFRNTRVMANRREQVTASVNTQTNDYNKYPASGYNWVQATRTTSSLVTVYVSGVKQRTITDTSTALINREIAELGAYDGSFVGGFYSNSKFACSYYGNGSVDSMDIMNVINTYMFSHFSTKAKIYRQNIHMGDSMSGSVFGAALSANGQFCYKTQTELGDGVVGVTVSQESRTVQTMATAYATEVQPYLNPDLDQDYIIWGGRNDIAIGSRTGTQCYDDMLTCISQALSDGFRRVVVVGIPDTQAGFVGTNQAGYDSERSTYHGLIDTEFATSTAVTNVYTSSNYPGAYYVKIHADSKFEDATDSTYFQADLIHPTSTLFDWLATEYVAPILAL